VFNGYVSSLWGVVCPRFQAVIVDITQRMGKGMAKFIETEVGPCAATHNAQTSSASGRVAVGMLPRST